MKNHLNAHEPAHRMLNNLILVASLALPLPALAAAVALASSPLATSSTTTVMPNVMFVLDDSGSMDWDYMPDDSKNFAGKYGFNANHCNGVYYNPLITYTPPVYATGTSYPDASFSGAWKSGYNTGLGTVNLDTGFTGGSGSGSSGAGGGYTGPAFYYEYLTATTTPAGPGTQTANWQQDFHNTNSIFYKECISTVGSTTAVDGTNPVNTVFKKVRLASTPTTTISVTSSGGGATITVSGNQTTKVSNVKVNGVNILDATTSQSSSSKTTASNIATGINNCTTVKTGLCTIVGGTGFSATCPGYPSCTSSVVTITGPGSAGGFSPVVTNGTCTGSCMSYTYTAFPVIASTYVSGIRVNGVELLLSGSTASSTTPATLAASIAAGINATGYTATASGSVVTITGPTSASTYTPVITAVPATGGLILTTDAFPESTPAKLKNFANWYSYYSNRMLMMKTGVGQAFSPIDAKYRVGFMTMNNNNYNSSAPIPASTADIAEIAPFDATQRSTWYSKLYAAKPGNSTPLREALSHVGQMYAHKFGDYDVYTATITVGGSGSTVVNSVSVNEGGALPAETMAGTTVGSTSTSTVASNIAAQINLLDPSNYGASVSGNIITITGPVAALNSYPVILDDDGGMTFSSTAFVKTTINAKLNGITPKDPVQYSCQQNFVILSTDGYWNGSTTYDLSSPNKPVGNQDGTAPRAMYDGGLFTKTTTQTSQRQTQLTEIHTQLQSRTTQVQSSTSNLQQKTSPLQWTTNLQQATGALQWTTKQQKTTGALQWATKQQATTATLTWATKQQQATGALQWATKQKATTATLTWATKQQATTATLTWATKQQVQTGYLQTKSSGSWVSVGANGSCTGATSQCRLNGSTSTSTTAVALTQSYLAYGATCTASGSFTSGTGGNANASGTVVSCPVNASFNGTVTNLTAGQICTGGGNIQCGTTSSAGPGYVAFPGTCTVSYNGASSTSTANASGKVVTACSISGSFNGTVTNLTAGQICTGGSNVQCGTTGSTGPSYLTTYPATCAVTYNGASSTSTADASSGKVVTACSTAGSYNTATAVGPNGTCDGTLTNIQCSNTGTAAYTTYASPSCSGTFNGAAALSNADGLGNVVTCSLNAAFGPTTNLTAGQTCTGGGNVQCGTTGSVGPSYVTTYPGTCTDTWNGAASTSTVNVGGKVVTCSTAASYGPATAVGASGTCDGTLANIQCSNSGTAAYVTTYPPACTQTFNAAGSSTADASGNTTACSIAASFNPTFTAIGANGTCDGTLANIQCSNAGTAAYVATYPPACSQTFNAAGSSTADASGKTTTCSTAAFNSTWTNVAGSGSCTAGANVNCQYAWPAAWSNVSSCSVNYSSGAGTWNITSGTDCQYSAWNAWVNSSSCTPAAQSAASPYTVGAATQCQTADTGWVGTASCANSGPTNGRTVYCNTPNSPVVLPGYPVPVASCTPQAALPGNGYVTISCSTATAQGSHLVASCTQGNTGAPDYKQTYCTTTTIATVTNASSCIAGNSGPPSYIQTTCTGGAGGTADTLADVAMYYYQTDIRDTSLANCTGALGSDVCYNNVFISGADNNVHQHMTTFTLGLGARGRMVYTSKNYMNDTSGDFYSVKLGSATNLTTTPPVCNWQTAGSVCNWPIPSSSSINNIDDLWHAAVNGRGTYFSASDPASLSDGLSSALSSITARKGAAAAAATSTLNPVAGNNFAYVASYTTVKWTGNLEARTIDTTNGLISKNASWCVDNLTADVCAAPSTVVTTINGSSTSYNCVTPNATTSTCLWPNVFDPVANTCAVPMALDCVGKLPPMVSATSDTRKIITANSSGTGFVDFYYANLTPTQQAYFNTTTLSGLSQWLTIVSLGKQADAQANIVNYLRGQYGYDDRATNLVSGVDNRLFRSREAVLGDALESQPSFIAAPTFSYADAGYNFFVTSQANRPGTVYMGTNDGMLHAFVANTNATLSPPEVGGTERWAFVPKVVMPNMWHLADAGYSVNHVNYVNGSPVISDIFCGGGALCPGGASGWRTILVGGLNAGGREYYALDITDPKNPLLLWEFTPTVDANLGYTFGVPVVTKMTNGTWVVLVTSGYDNGLLGSNGLTANSPAGDGIGRLYVLDARTGAIIKSLSTGVGTAATPSGLGKISVWNNATESNVAGYTYGGDLLGNVWRFDINASASPGVNPLLFATLKDPSGVAQPITSAPILGMVAGKHVVFVGTGKYLETSDLGNTQKQSLYAIKDDGATATLVNPGGSPRNSLKLVQQTITPTGGVRVGSYNKVDFTVDRGWYVDFPDSGERVNIDGKLVLGTLLVPTIVPASTVCSPGGYGWLNFFDYTNGWPTTDGTGVGAGGTNKNVSVKFDASIVGMNILFINGKPVVEVVTSDNPTPTIPPVPPVFNTGNSTFTGKRMQWRELIP